jgi:hypothetical protein
MLMSMVVTFLLDINILLPRKKELTEDIIFILQLHLHLVKKKETKRSMFGMMFNVIRLMNGQRSHTTLLTKVLGR